MSDFSIGAPVYGNEYDGRVEALEDRADALEAQTAEILPDMVERPAAPNVNLNCEYPQGETVNGAFTQLYTFGGTQVGMTDGSGHFDIDFPVAMSKIVYCNHDNGDGVAWDFYTQTLATNGAQCTIVCKVDAGTPLANENVRITFSVMGAL